MNTSQAISQINSGNVDKAVIHDKEQSLELDLKTPVDGHTKISTSYPADATASIFNDLQAKVPTQTDFTHQGQQEQRAGCRLLVSLLPFLLIVGVLFFVMSQVQGGGNRVMSFGRSKAKLVSKDTPKTTFADVAGADEAIEELQEIKEFLPNPAKFQASAPRSPRACCSTDRPEPARPCWRAPSPARPACRSTRSPGRTSSRCSSASAPPGSATCSSRPRPTLRRSSSSTRSTPSGGTAAPAWAAATTSASRRSTSCWSRWTASTSRAASS